MHIKELVPVFARVSEKSEKELLTLLTENAENDDWDTKTVSKVITDIISDHSKSILEDRKQSLSGEAFKKINKKIKDEFGVQSSLTDVDLVKDIIQKQVAKVKADFEKSKEALTPETVRQNPMVIELLKEKDTEIEAKITTAVESIQKKLDTAEAELSKGKEQTFVKGLYDEAIKAHQQNKSMIFDKEGVLLPQREQFIKDKIDLMILKGQIRESEDGSVEILDDKGELMRNDLHKPVSYPDFIVQINPFGNYNQDQSKSSVNVDKRKHQQSTGTPKDLSEAFEMVTKIQDDPNSTPEQKSKALEDYKALRKSAATA